MKEMTVGEIAGLVNGRLHGPGCGAVTGVTKDSRGDCAGLIYAAIPGNRVDGHDFIGMAFEKGAACCLALRVPEGEERPVIVVNDVENAIKSLAAQYRQRLSIPIIGITGSVGKTTAKEMIAAVLSRRYNVHRTEKNFNNELGVPLTILRIEPEHEVSVIEMGISDFGEMTRLADMVRPTMAVYTVIGRSHLERLGDRAGVFTAKTEMLRFMPEDGAVFANGDDELLRAMECRQRKILYGVGDGCGVRAENIVFDGIMGTKLDIVRGTRRISAYIPSYGAHLVYAALSAAAVGIEMGLTDEEIADGISSYKPVGRRASVTETGFITLIDDCYNANPDSVRAAIDSMSRLKGRKVYILGDMLELGGGTEALHRAVGEYAAESGADLVLTAGPLSCGISDAAAKAGCVSRHYADTEALAEALPGLIMPGDLVLVKASHSMRFELISEALKNLPRQ